jgi:phytanoyl-CoA hydroxylase
LCKRRIWAQRCRFFQRPIRRAPPTNIFCSPETSCVSPSAQLTRPRSAAINKIGHALHDLDPLFATLSRTGALAAVTAALRVRSPLLLQSMYIFKAPGVGGEVVSHQDATFIYTDPITCMGLWVALEDATLENGCLWALPGGHRLGLKRRFKRAAGGGTTFEEYDRTPVPEDQMVPLPVQAGTLVVLHGLLPHRSGENRSPRSRHAYSVHLVEADARYPADNWLQRSADFPPRGFDAFSALASSQIE